MTSKISKTEALFKILPDHIQYEIEMQLYDEFNNMHIFVENEIYNGRMSKKEKTYWVRAETIRKRELTERWLKENEITGYRL